MVRNARVDEQIPDQNERVRALTEHDRTLIVEAGAGTGKTALLSGRVVTMLSEGIQAKEIVAITFTEAAASELEQRIEGVARSLLTASESPDDSPIPLEVADAFPLGLDSQQLTNLRRAVNSLDELTCTTIHGFCQRLIRPYPVESNQDPGAQIVQESMADRRKEELIVDWIWDHCGRTIENSRFQLASSSRSSDSPNRFFSSLIRRDVSSAIRLTRSFAQKLFQHRTAVVQPPQDSFSQAKSAFFDAFDDFVSHYQSSGLEVDDVEKVIGRLTSVTDYIESHIDEDDLEGSLLRYLDLRESSDAFTSTGNLLAYSATTQWTNAAKKNRLGAQLGKELSLESKQFYAQCKSCLSSLDSVVIEYLVSYLYEELSPLRSHWETYKRESALLDFDDLLYFARDLVRDNEAVRNALSVRFPRILVDEFQDTDPLQAEILWRLAAKKFNSSEDWMDYPLRPGALFLVGDPKQAIYRFRQADIDIYMNARESIVARDSEALLEITTNFRSRPEMLDWINNIFSDALDESEGQPGFERLRAYKPSSTQSQISVAQFEVNIGHREDKKRRKTMDEIREIEAKTVGHVVQQLVGSYPLGDTNGHGSRLATWNDIALLVPAGTNLQIYENEFEKRGIPIASQAGKNFYRTQEVHDLIALTRTLADSADTVAFGALIRGPFVGLTENEIADETLNVRNSKGQFYLTVKTDPDTIKHSVLKDTLQILQSLRKMRDHTTPYQLLSRAVELMNVRPLLRSHSEISMDRTLANVNTFLETAREYSALGIREFASAMKASWVDGSDRKSEGKPDPQVNAISIMTSHAAKGLEWPIVIPVNTFGSPFFRVDSVLDRESDELHFKFFGKSSHAYDEVAGMESAQASRERIRLWYVTLTRAEELLLLPFPTRELRKGSWFGMLSFKSPDLQDFEFTESTKVPPRPREAVNQQSLETWNKEQATIGNRVQTVRWLRPSAHDANRSDRLEQAFDELLSTSVSSNLTASLTIQGGPQRGTILHKLIEEVLNRETEDRRASLRTRARELIGQLGLREHDDPAKGLSSREIADTVHRTFESPSVKSLLPDLIPEFNVYNSSVVGNRLNLVSGIADAVTVKDDGKIDIIIDWKSDVEVSDRDLRLYQEQILDYMNCVDSKRGMLVFCTTGQVVRVGEWSGINQQA